MTREKAPTSPAENNLRANEPILDRHYKTLNFWHIPPESAVYVLLAVYDSMAVPIALRGPHPNLEVMIKRFEEGLGQSLKWILSDVGPGSISSLCTPSALEDGYSFLTHASDYVDVADFHKMFGRGLVDIESPDESTINFIPRNGDNVDLIGLLETIASSKKRVQEAFEMSPRTKGKVSRRLAQVKHTLQDGRLVFPSFKCLVGAGVVREFAPIVPAPPFPLPPEADLCGFSAGELRTFWVSLFFWSQMSIGRFLALARNGVPQHECMPVQVVTREKFVTNISDISGLDVAIVSSITDRLSSSSGQGDLIDPTTRPLLIVGDCVTWSNLYVMSFRPERNVLRVMARDSELKRIADNLIGSREHQVAREVERRLKKRGYHTKRDVDISLGDAKGQIDLLAWRSSYSSEVLLIEVKALLAPDEVNEVDSATKMMKKGQEQLEKCIQILADAPMQQKRRWYQFVDWNDLTKEYFGIVVTAEGEPSSLLDNSRFPSIAATTLQDRVRSECYRSPGTLVARVRERAWLGDVGSRTLGRKTVCVGNLKYGMPSWEASSK